MSTARFRTIALTLCVLSAGCAGINYQGISQEPRFGVPTVHDLTKLDAEIKRERDDLTRIDGELAALRAAVPPDPNLVSDKEVERKLVQDKLGTLEQEKTRIETENAEAQKLAERVQTENAGIAARNRASDNSPFLGIRFYQPSPYLLVYSDGKGGLSWEIHHLPDPAKKMSAKPYNYASTLEAKLTFDDHFRLTKTHEVADSTAIPVEVLTRIAELAPLLAANLPKAENEHELPAPQLFKIVQAGGEVSLIGGAREPQVVHVTLLPGSGEAKPKAGGQ